MPIPANAKEIVFSDKYSICIINSDKLNKLKNTEIKKIAENFITILFYLTRMHVLPLNFVVRQRSSISIKKKFWKNLSLIAQSKYKLEASSNIDKLMKLHEDLTKLQNIKNIYKMNKYIYRVQLKKLSKNLHELRGNGVIFMSIA